MALMLITHNLRVVAEMAEDVAVMYLGRVVEQGPVDTIFHDAKDPYTRVLPRPMPTFEAPARSVLPTTSGSIPHRIPHPYNRPSGCSFHRRCPSVIRYLLQRPSVSVRRGRAAR